MKVPFLDFVGPYEELRAELDEAWADPQQRERALDSLVADGLAEPLADGRYALPG